MSTAQDKHGTEIEPGDTVEVIYGGDYHHMVVDDITESGFGDHWILAGTITIHVPATATHHLRHAEPPALAPTPPPEEPAPAEPPPSAAPATPPSTAAPGPAGRRTNAPTAVGGPNRGSSAARGPADMAPAKSKGAAEVPSTETKGPSSSGAPSPSAVEVKGPKK